MEAPRVRGRNQRWPEHERQGGVVSWAFFVPQVEWKVFEISKMFFAYAASWITSYVSRRAMKQCPMHSRHVNERVPLQM